MQRYEETIQILVPNNTTLLIFYAATFFKLFQGYTIPLDKRLAADGRGLQQTHINENFAKLAEALYIADRKVFHIHPCNRFCCCY